MLTLLRSQLCVGYMDPPKTFDDIKEYWELCIIVKRNKPLDTTTVTAFAVTAVYDDTHFDLKALVMRYHFTYVKQLQVPEPPRRRALDDQDLGDAFDIALALTRQYSLQ